VPMDWRPAVTKVLRNSISLQLLGDYWRLLWEIAASCPIPYLAADAIPRSAVRELNAQLESYKFSVFIDGRQLFKPVYLKGNEEGYTTRLIERQTLMVYGKALTFSGYIAVQEGKQLKPDELRGILVRIKNVGIGYYDPSMLDYRVNQGPRSRWVTGEVFIEQGLEDALNIDRDSFNRFHPEFRALQVAVHNVLQNEIFPEVYGKIEVRSAKRQEEKASKRDRAVKKVVREAETRSVRIVKRSMTQSESAEPEISSGHRQRDNIEIVVPRAEDLPTSKPSRQLAQAILTIFELSLLESDRSAQRRKFTELLLNLLKEW
jgi:hypothetical protein